MKKHLFKTLNLVLGLINAVLLIACAAGTDKVENLIPKGFVKVDECCYESKGNPVHVAAFEILDHPVTNREYKAFIDATTYPAPPHWKKGRIPEGKEEHPVVFVNRDDVTAYTEWLTELEGRVYRIPTPPEFEIAARGGKKTNSRYFWGDDESVLDNAEQINFNITGNRRFDEMECYLKPARWGLQNSLGLYQMCGNVWQLVNVFEDPISSDYKYRIEKSQDIERRIMGGSWAATKEFLRVGDGVSQSPGIRYPDLGIRLVRAPEGVDWREENRNVVAIPDGKGEVTISWALLPTDTKETRFNIYCVTGRERSHKGIKLNDEPIYHTSFAYEGLMDQTQYQFSVISVDAEGKELRHSDWASFIAGQEKYPVVAKFKPVMSVGSTMVPIFGNLEGYGKLNCVIRLDNNNKEASQDPGVPVQLEAFSYTGKSLWRKNIASHDAVFGSASNAPFNVWDMDGDGKDEVITLLEIDGENYVAILDGMSGTIKYKTLWDKMATDISRSSTRIQMSVGYLDGKNPAIITQTGIYENEIISAYDYKLNRLWTYKGFMGTSGSGGHKVEMADVDGDGKQEIFYGTTVLNHDGTVRWSIYKQHPDIISIHDYIPDRPGLEVCYIVETAQHAGIYMVDANTGEIIWCSNRNDDPYWSHGHVGWTADIWDGSPGMECMTNRAGHQDQAYILFSSNGERITEEFPIGFLPMEWDGDHTRELVGQNGRVIGKFDGKKIVLLPDETPNPIPDSKLLFTADLVGDFRSELIISAIDTDGRSAIMVLAASKPMEKRYVTPTREFEYKLWLARNMGGGYGSVYEYGLHDTLK